METEQVQVCKVRRRRVELSTPLREFLELFDETKAYELVLIIRECIENIEPAWFFQIPEVDEIELVELELEDEGQKTLRERLIDGYRAKAEEDLEIANEFVWVEAEADEYSDK